MENEYVLYILMRQDLPSMNPGKAMAQASHASNAFVSETDSGFRELKEWQSQTEQGFGTVLVLGCTLTDILEIEETKNPFIFGKVVDPTYPYIVNSEIVELIDSTLHTLDPKQLDSGDFVCFREEVTCAYLFGDKNDETTIGCVGHLELHP